jgi:hypothetical protein
MTAPARISNFGHRRSPAAVSVSLRGKRRFSGVDVERARLLHQYALDRASADAQCLANLQYAHDALVEAQDALSSFRGRSPGRTATSTAAV